MSIEQNVKRTAELTRMFAAYGIKAAEERIAAYLTTLRGVPDRYFFDAIDKAMRDCVTGFPPAPGEVYAASLSINHARAELVAAEPVPAKAKAIPAGKIDFDPQNRRVPKPNRSTPLPSGTAAKFDGVHKPRMKVYVDAAWIEAEQIEGTARERMNYFRHRANAAWELACADIANESSDVGEFARRVWEKRKV